MFPFSGSRAELYLAARPPFTGIAKKTGYRPQKTRPTNSPHVTVQVSQCRSPVFKGKLTKLCKIHTPSKVGSLPFVRQQLQEPHVRYIEKD